MDLVPIIVMVIVKFALTISVNRIVQIHHAMSVRKASVNTNAKRKIARAATKIKDVYPNVVVIIAKPAKTVNVFPVVMRITAKYAMKEIVYLAAQEIANIATAMAIV